MLGKVFENLILGGRDRARGERSTRRAPWSSSCVARRWCPTSRRADAAGPEEAVRNADHRRRRSSSSWPPTTRARTHPARQHRPMLRPNCRVLDPAVGSGAFPLGMLTELVRLRQPRPPASIVRQEPTSGDPIWAWKLATPSSAPCSGSTSTPRRSRAVSPAPLACPAGRRSTPGAVQPLPNLDYRTVCADSLSDFIAGRRDPADPDGVLTLGLDLSTRPLWSPCASATSKNTRRPRRRAFARNSRPRKTRSSARSSPRLTRTPGSSRRHSPRRCAHAASSRSETAPRGRPICTRAIGDSHSSCSAFHAPEVVRDGGWDAVIDESALRGSQRSPFARFSETLCADLGQALRADVRPDAAFAFRALELRARTAASR